MEKYPPFSSEQPDPFLPDGVEVEQSANSYAPIVSELMEGNGLTEAAKQAYDELSHLEPAEAKIEALRWIVSVDWLNIAGPLNRLFNEGLITRREHQDTVAAYNRRVNEEIDHTPDLSGSQGWAYIFRQLLKAANFTALAETVPPKIVRMSPEEAKRAVLDVLSVMIWTNGWDGHQIYQPFLEAGLIDSTEHEDLSANLDRKLAVRKEKTVARQRQREAAQTAILAVETEKRRIAAITQQLEERDPSVREWPPTLVELVATGLQEPTTPISLADALDFIASTRNTTLSYPAFPDTITTAELEQMIAKENASTDELKAQDRAGSIRFMYNAVDHHAHANQLSYLEAALYLVRTAELPGIGKANLPTWPTLLSYRFNVGSVFWYGQAIYEVARRQTEAVPPLSES